ncbi:LysR-family transcriptional regulator [Pectobacterium atrosepticum SCRI1043]|uniref:LysR-family transcriptional regulator n=1 Tax=Pectobacterium atrosepticum (strain SCRI 1043 / ATCC BAA-672) TaxID=218491 RepID=Q6D0Z4_PECAS|nr:LysR family transcriptional regulator [Pectobacterium atrosepticum]GKV86795.1 LysR family transcriptional regulator [Pectobacterium carotovorum subsp. carotovorum]AIA72442.1 LysR family transcriptional regulator [Pectobacterium atrosepticum]AIK15423.1 transcriptional regulator, LysR family [Pectobacterium atrosepticum]ATY92177.1 LysR family transcriptional regulator [Pectobacterium atrosepticum]KFX14544.1 LysR family transcriptional regulator [Pectobacterium atrosepticum]
MDRITAAEVFVTIIDRGSMIAAAETLDMSRAMVTRYLAEMEAWAGARLLHRTTRKLSLTDAGEKTLVRCREMLALTADMRVEANTDDATLSGLLRLSCSQSLAQGALGIAITAFLRRHPRVAIDLQMNNRSVNLVEERIDLALRITNELDPNLIARPLANCESVLCASPSYLNEHGIPRQLTDLSIHNCLTYTYFGKSLWHFSRGDEKFTIPVSGNLSGNESLVLLSGALEGAGIALQPRYSVTSYLASGQLVALLPEYRPQMMGIYGIYTSRRQMPTALRTLLDFLVEWFAHDPRWRGLTQ